MLRRLAALTALLTLCAAGTAAAQERVSPRIVGGTTVTAPGAYPWQVALEYYGDDDAWHQYCGGTLIAARYVLTADHCDVYVGDTVRVGSLSRNTGGSAYTVAQVRRHPLSDARDDTRPSRYDVNVLELTQDVAPAHGRPVEIATPAESALWAPPTMLTITGFGTTSSGGSSSSTLRVAQVPRRTDPTCQTAYPLDFFVADQFCAAPVQGGVDTCQGDSGGPIVAPLNDATITDPADWRLVGATSYGTGCADARWPGVYARVSDTEIYPFTGTTPPVAGTATLTGEAKVGATLTCATDGWSGGRAYRQWTFLRNGVSLGRSSSSTRTVTSGDRAHALTCRAHGDNGAGSATTAASNAVAIPADGGGAPITPAPPTTPTTPTTPTVPTVPSAPAQDAVPLVPTPAPATATPAPAATTATRTTVGSIGRSCKKRRCTFTITSTARALKVTLKRGRATATIYRAKARKNGRFTVTTGRLRKGRYVATVTGATTTKRFSFRI